MGKLVCKGKAWLNLTDIVDTKMETKVEQKLQIFSSKAAIDATLLVIASTMN